MADEKTPGEMGTIRQMMEKIIPALQTLGKKKIPGGATLGNITANLIKVEEVIQAHTKTLETIRKEGYQQDEKGGFKLDKENKLIPVSETAVKEADAKYKEYLDSPCDVKLIKLNNKVLQMIDGITPELLAMLDPIRYGEFTGD